MNKQTIYIEDQEMKEVDEEEDNENEEEKDTIKE